MIQKIDGRSISTFEDIYPVIQDRPGVEMTVEASRNGRGLTLKMTPETVQQTDRFGNVYRIGRVGIAPTAQPNIRKVGPLEAVGVGVRRCLTIVDRMITGIAQVIMGYRSVSELGGPIKIAQISGEAAALGWQQFVYLAALISINLGFINLLPVPMLDGGHLSFYAVEAIQRRPVSPRTMEIAFRSGMYALLALMLFVTLNDLGSLGLWRLTGMSE